MRDDTSKQKQVKIFACLEHGDIVICYLIKFVSKYIQSYFTWRGLVCAAFAVCQDCMSIRLHNLVQRRTSAAENHFSVESIFLDRDTMIVLSGCTY